MLLETLDVNDTAKLRAAGEQCRHLMLSHPLPEKIQQEITQFYVDLCKKYSTDGVNVDCAVRSSATAEDLPTASFAGQQGAIAFDIQNL